MIIIIDKEVNILNQIIIVDRLLVSKILENIIVYK